MSYKNLSGKVLVELPDYYCKDLTKLLILNEENNVPLEYDNATGILNNEKWWKTSGTTDENKISVDLYTLLEALKGRA